MAALGTTAQRLLKLGRAAVPAAIFFCARVNAMVTGWQ
jgi:hypothetical protein